MMLRSTKMYISNHSLSAANDSENQSVISVNTEFNVEHFVVLNGSKEKFDLPLPLTDMTVHSQVLLLAFSASLLMLSHQLLHSS